MSLSSEKMSPEQRLERVQVQQRPMPRGRSGPGLREVEGGRERTVGDEARGSGTMSHGASEAIVKPLAFLLGGKGSVGGFRQRREVANLRM